MYVIWVASLEANRNTRTRTCGSDKRLMLPPDRGGVPVAVLLIRCRPECHSKAGFSLDHRTSESFPAKHINAAYLLSSNSTFGRRFGTNRINRRALTPGSRYLIHRSLSSENFLS